MENIRRILIKFVFLGIAILAIPFFVFSYDAVVTHPGLTREIAKFYNLTFGKDNKLSEQEISFMAQGAVDEDITPRWLNHYYNPETKKGLQGDNLGWLPDKLTKTGISVFVSSKDPVSSKNWARNQSLQQAYFLYGGNHTYQKAMLEYAKGNKKQAFLSLGNLLHLIEDSSVPDHTRSDAHADIAGTNDKGSPYEIFVEKNNYNGIDLADKIYSKNLSPYKFDTYEEYLENLAKYSHYNFFSKDTIFDYDEPIVVSKNVIIENENIREYYNKYGIKIAEALLEEGKLVYDISKDEIMLSYWEDLSREAMLNGVGVIDLFLREAEALKNDKDRIAEMIKEERASIIDNVLNQSIAFSPANTIQKVSNKVASTSSFVYEKTKERFVKTYNNIKNKILNTTSGFLIDDNKNNIDDSEDEEYENSLSELSRLNLYNKNEPEESSDNFKELDQDEIYERNIEIERLKEKLKDLENQVKILIDKRNNNFKNEKENKITEIKDNLEDYKIALEEEKYKNKDYSEENVGGAKEYARYINGDVIFSEIDWKGNSENSSYEWIELYANKSVNLEGWTIEKQDSNGNLSFLIGDSGDNFNNTHSVSQGEYFLLERNELATSILSDKIYDGSLGNQGEYLILKDANGVIIDEVNYLNGWIENSNDYSRTISKISGVWSTGIETPKAINQAYIAPVEDEEQSSQIIYNERDIVINEIAWMGDSNSVNNEWIELYNATTTAINLSNWKLEAQDGTPDITLSGTINQGEYFLLERNELATSILADLIYTGALSNTGEVLILKDGTNKEIDRVDDWHAGDNDNKKTMQRISSSQSGTLLTNWISNAGTPKAQNNISAPLLPPTLSYNSGDVIINELSWAGTEASVYDEYIELRNTTNEDIDLIGWTVELTPNNASTTIIALSNAIETVIQTGNATSTTPYFLMERGEDDTVSNISADLIYTGSINNSNFTIRLIDPSGNVIDSVSTLNEWEKGDNDNKKSMERKADLTWITFGETNEYGADGYYLNVDSNTFIKDANNNKILGSPKRPNSDIEDYPPNGNLSFLLTFN